MLQILHVNIRIALSLADFHEFEPSFILASLQIDLSLPYLLHQLNIDVALIIKKIPTKIIIRLEAPGEVKLEVVLIVKSQLCFVTLCDCLMRCVLVVDQDL